MCLYNMQYDKPLLRSFYDRKAKWIPKGTIMHGSNILPQIINWKKEGI